VPREAITLGVSTILEAREIALIATGEHKAEIVRRAVEGDVSQDVAATYLQAHGNATVYLDLAAAAELTRIKTPWLLESVAWTPALIDQAVVWLAEGTGKAILKLSERDYTEHHLSPLLAQHGAAGPINGGVFNRLGSKIRGRSKLPSRQRVLAFSPHPDDDVISMGGILRKLWENENAIVVAYMTSGNIAVFDHDVRRHLDFVERAAEPLGLDRAALHRVRAQVEARFDGKAPGDVDLPLVQDVKRMIRESEAIAALEAVGLPRSAARFLNLPSGRSARRTWPSSGRCSRRFVPISCSWRAICRTPTAPTGCARRPLSGRSRDTTAPGPRCGCTAAPGRSGRSRKPTYWCRSPRTSCAPRFSRFLNTSPRRIPPRSPGPTTTASSGSGSRPGTSRRRRTPTGSGSRSITRWKPTASSNRKEAGR